LVCFNLFLMIVIHCNHIIKNLKNHESTDILAALLANMIYFPLIIFRNLVVIFNRRDIIEICDSLREIFPKTRADQQKYKIRNFQRIFTLLCRILYSLAIIGCLMYTLEGITSFLLFGTKRFAFDLYIPVEHESLYIHLPIMAYLVYTPITVFIMQCVNDIFIALIILGLAQGFEILAEDLSDLLNDQNVKVKDFKLLVDRHNQLIALGKSIQKVFSPALLFMFVVSSIMLCFNGFVILMSTGVLRVTFIISGSFMVVYTFMQFYCGQKLIDSSVKVADAVYDSNWEGIKEVKVQKCVALIVLRAQNAISLNGCGFFIVNYETFTAVRAL
jgi:Zn-dependent protease with chaperone function